MSVEYFEAKNLEELCALLGLPTSQAPKVAMRRDLVIAIRRTLEKRELTHAAAAQIAHVGRTVITAIVNANIEKISTDRLIDIAYALGLNVQLSIKRAPKAIQSSKPRSTHGRSRAMVTR